MEGASGPQAVASGCLDVVEEARPLHHPLFGGRSPSPIAAALGEVRRVIREKDQTACKPGSVPPPSPCEERDAAAIPLDRPLPTGSRDQPGSLGAATLLPARIPKDVASAGPLFGLAPGGACHAAPVASGPVRSYRTLSPLPSPRRRRSALCGAIPGVAPGGRYPPPCRRGARTFLELSPATARPSDPARNSVDDDIAWLCGQVLDHFVEQDGNMGGFAHRAPPRRAARCWARMSARPARAFSRSAARWARYASRSQISNRSRRPTTATQSVMP